MQSICPNCGVIERNIAQQIGGKITFGLAGLALGNQAKEPIVAAVCAGVGVLVGHVIDQAVGKKCPVCNAVLLQIAEDLI
jgi:hypothetical protein